MTSFIPCTLQILAGGKIYYTRIFGWPTAILVLAPAEGWKDPSGPAENLWPHLIYSSLEGFRNFLEKSDIQTHRRTHEVTHTQTHPQSDTHTDALGTPHPMNCFTVPPLPHTPPLLHTLSIQ